MHVKPIVCPIGENFVKHKTFIGLSHCRHRFCVCKKKGEQSSPFLQQFPKALNVQIGVGA